MIFGLAHVCIESSDLDDTEKFYSCLGMERRFEFRNVENELVGFYLAFGNGTYIEVIKVNETKRRGVVKHFAVEVEDVSKVRDVLLDFGADVSERKLGGDNTWMVSWGRWSNFFSTHRISSNICRLFRYRISSWRWVGYWFSNSLNFF